ncbi:diguanylate cyclase [Lutibacter sp. B2]|nr:diguanylate cyclase [Lutibacter sp. B2]
MEIIKKNKISIIEEQYIGFQLMALLINIFSYFEMDRKWTLEDQIFLATYTIYIGYIVYLFMSKGFFEKDTMDFSPAHITPIMDIVIITYIMIFQERFEMVLCSLYYLFIIYHTMRFPRKNTIYWVGLVSSSCFINAFIKEKLIINFIPMIFQIGVFWIFTYVFSSVVKALSVSESKNEYMIKELAQKNKMLIEYASQDYLTSLLNHKSFYEYLEKIFVTTKTFSVCILDIDNFKKVNDQYGHIAGDEILKQVADILKASVCSTDIVSRYGGEEFAIIFPNTKIELAKIICERIRLNIQEAAFKALTKNINITISGGVKEINKEVYLEAQKKFVDSVDQLLYKAKMSGKNKILG